MSEGAAGFWVAFMVCAWVTAIFGICMWRIRKDAQPKPKPKPKVDIRGNRGFDWPGCIHEHMERVSWAESTWICVTTPVCHYTMSSVAVSQPRTIYKLPLGGRDPIGPEWSRAKANDVFVDSDTGQTWVKH